jgi:hypothetical protein
MDGYLIILTYHKYAIYVSVSTLNMIDHFGHLKGAMGDITTWDLQEKNR